MEEENSTPEQPGIVRAVAAAGGQVKMAQSLGVTQQAVSLWLKRGFAPVDRAIEIEHLYGVPRLSTINPRLASQLDPGSGL